MTTLTYNIGEIRQARRIPQELMHACEVGDVDQHASPALGIAIDYLDPIRLSSTCDVCGLPFSFEEWEERYSTPDGEDCHERCFSECAA